MKEEVGLKFILFILLSILLAAPLHQALAAGDPQDCKGCKDPALFSRMPGFHIYNRQDIEFDRFEFPVAPGKSQNVEGRHYYVNYYANEGIKLPSALQIVRNYVNAASAIGGKEIYEYEDGGNEYATIKVVKGDAEIWAQVEGAGNGMYKINIIEKQKMKQEVVANAEALAANINETGRSVVQGIYFDTDKAEIKPESAPAISEIVKMLRANPTLKVYVVGHTDNVGTFDHNIKLSRDRAAAVVYALAKKNGISDSRLTSFGAGPTSPVASNKSEEGRAKNRRVELVAQ